MRDPIETTRSVSLGSTVKVTMLSVLARLGVNGRRIANKMRRKMDKAFSFYTP
jgi:hypothetical protein